MAITCALCGEERDEMERKIISVVEAVGKDVVNDFAINEALVNRVSAVLQSPLTASTTSSMVAPQARACRAVYNM